MGKAEHLALIATCFHCPEREAALIGDCIQFRRYDNRAPVAFRGDMSAHLFLVVEGTASAELFGISGQYAQLAGYGPGEIFGAFPVPVLYRADIVALGGLSVLMIETSQIAALASQHAAIAHGVAHLMAKQLDLVLDRMAARIGLSATGRIYRALLAKADDHGWISPSPVLSALAIGVNTTRETASRALADVVRRGIVERHEHGLRVVSVRMLEELVV